MTSAVNGSKTLATVAYDDYGRRSSLTYGNGTSVTYGFDGGGRLDELDWNLNGTTNDFNYDFTYTPSSQTASKTISDVAFDWVPGAYGVDNYTANGLNQYTDVAGAAVTYDDAGNIATDHRGRDYVYDAENRLVTVKDVNDATLNSYAHYSDGTMRWSTGNHRYYYAGDQELAEYIDAWPIGGGDAVLQRRYIRLPGSVDEPILMIDYTLNGACTNTSYAACEVWSHQDRLGSVVATSDSLGNKLDTYTYSPYGESGPEGDAGFPFRFTGQKLDATTGLYYYKARFYDPEVGRFLQTDPIGYGDGMNMYAYAGGDPANATDPSGLKNTTPDPGTTARDNPNGDATDNIIVTGTRIDKPDLRTEVLRLSIQLVQIASGGGGKGVEGGGGATTDICTNRSGSRLKTECVTVAGNLNPGQRRNLARSFRTFILANSSANLSRYAATVIAGYGVTPAQVAFISAVSQFVGANLGGWTDIIFIAGAHELRQESGNDNVNNGARGVYYDGVIGINRDQPQLFNHGGNAARTIIHEYLHGIHGPSGGALGHRGLDKEARRRLNNYGLADNGCEFIFGYGIGFC